MDEPRTLYEPVLLTDDEEGVAYQAGAFSSQAEAEKVLEIWRQEGRPEAMAINFVTVYDTAAEWYADR